MRLVAAMLGMVLLAGGVTAGAQKDPDVGNVAMSPKKTILENAGNSPIHKTLVTAIYAAGLEPTLSGAGPFTVFAPTDDAFNKLPPGTVTRLVRPGSKDELTHLLTYHVVPGKLTAKKLAKMIKKNGGTAALTTVEGGTLKATRTGSILTLTDEKGGFATVTTEDVLGKNGVLYVIDTVLMPR